MNNLFPIKTFIIAVLLTLFITPVSGQVKGKLKLKFSEPVTVAADSDNKGYLECTIEDGVMKKGEQGAKLTLFARNNLRNIPMQLVKDDRALKAKLMVNNVIFGVPVNDIFFTRKSDLGYRWKWIGRARAPISPIAPVAGKKVDSVQCWAILHFNAESYISDTITIQIK